MMLNKINTIERYVEIVEQYRSKEGASNDYLQREAETLINNGELFEVCNRHNAFLFVKKNTGFRMYYYINDFNAKPDFNELKDVVVEILYRGKSYFPQKEIEYLEKVGFRVNLIRDQYLGIYKDLERPIKIEGVKVEFAKNLWEIEKACKLFNDSFDILSGDYITSDMYEKLLINNAIWIAHGIDNNKFLGALHQTFTGKTACISHVAVIPEGRGRHVGQVLLDTFIEKNMENEKHRYMLWVQHQNTVAVSMYQKKGFKYTFKSTISLIK